jgi:hypothetical protein
MHLSFKHFSDRLSINYTVMYDLLKYMLLKKLKERVECEIFVKWFRSTVFMKHCKYREYSVEVGMFSRG